MHFVYNISVYYLLCNGDGLSATTITGIYMYTDVDVDIKCGPGQCMLYMYDCVEFCVI